MSVNLTSLDKLQSFLEENQANAETLEDLNILKKEIESLLFSRDFYKRRVDLLQKWQSRMGEPARTIVCDILANGQTLPEDIFPERYVKGASL